MANRLRLAQGGSSSLERRTTSTARERERLAAARGAMRAPTAVSSGLTARNSVRTATGCSARFTMIVSTEDGLRVRSRRACNMAAALPELRDLPPGPVLDGELVAFNSAGDADVFRVAPARSG